MKNAMITPVTREKFVRKHAELCTEAFGLERPEALEKVVKLARKKLGYSPKTTSVDIRSTLRRTFNLAV